jgi:hypothetical protein
LGSIGTVELAIRAKRDPIAVDIFIFPPAESVMTVDHPSPTAAPRHERMDSVGVNQMR